MISKKVPLSIYGNTGACETASLHVSISQDKQYLELSKKNVSSEDFEELSNICLRAAFPDGQSSDQFLEMIRALDFRKDFLPMKRTAYVQEVLGGCPEYSEDTYFRYLPLTEAAWESLYTDALTVDQKKTLWLLFLRDAVSPIEFEDTFERLSSGLLETAFSWELALRLAMAEAGVAVLYDESGFRIIDQNNCRIRCDYEFGQAAEKLLLKLLFPRPLPSAGGKL